MIECSRLAQLVVRPAVNRKDASSNLAPRANFRRVGQRQSARLMSGTRRFESARVDQVVCVRSELASRRVYTPQKLVRFEPHVPRSWRHRLTAGHWPLKPETRDRHPLALKQFDAVLGEW